MSLVLEPVQPQTDGVQPAVVKANVDLAEGVRSEERAERAGRGPHASEVLRAAVVCDLVEYVVYEHLSGSWRSFAERYHGAALVFSEACADPWPCAQHAPAVRAKEAPRSAEMRLHVSALGVDKHYCIQRTSSCSAIFDLRSL
jgi:hypothetical protein